MNLLRLILVALLLVSLPLMAGAVGTLRACCPPDRVQTAIPGDAEPLPPCHSHHAGQHDSLPSGAPGHCHADMGCGTCAAALAPLALAVQAVLLSHLVTYPQSRHAAVMLAFADPWRPPRTL
jgi:hypothetical protein